MHPHSDASGRGATSDITTKHRSTAVMSPELISSFSQKKTRIRHAVALRIICFSPFRIHTLPRGSFSIPHKQLRADRNRPNPMFTYWTDATSHRYAGMDQSPESTRYVRYNISIRYSPSALSDITVPRPDFSSASASAFNRPHGDRAYTMQRRMSE